MAKSVSARTTTFFTPQSAMKAMVLFDQMKVSEKRTESKKLKETIKKPRRFHLIKSNKEVTLKIRKIYFLYRKPQK